jgi:hypothetical protein
METTALTMFQETIKYSGEDIFIQPFCDFFQIDYLNQRKVINRNSLLKKAVSKKTSMLLFGDDRERICLTKRGFLTWILQLRCQIVHPSLKEKLEEYQELIFDFLFGSIERENKAKINYARLIKLKKLKAKINQEIARCELQTKSFLIDKWLQPELPFK